MKLFFVAVFLAMVFGFATAKVSLKDVGNKVIANNRGYTTFADVAKAVVELNEDEKKKFGEGAAESIDDKTCMEQLKPILTTTSSKYLHKIVKGVPWYKKDGKEFNMRNFFSHSKLYKTATNNKCIGVLIDNIGKAAKWGCKKAFNLIAESLAN